MEIGSQSNEFSIISIIFDMCTVLEEYKNKTSLQTTYKYS